MIQKHEKLLKDGKYPENSGVEHILIPREHRGITEKWNAAIGMINVTLMIGKNSVLLKSATKSARKHIHWRNHETMRTLGGKRPIRLLKEEISS